MVAKMSSGSSAYGALSYNQEKVDKEKAEVLWANRMIEPKNGEWDISCCMRSFEPYLAVNQRTEKPVLHISLNPDPKDKLTNDQLSDMAQEYMQKMGYGNQPYIVYKHEDIQRRHIHIVTLRIDENGKKLDHNFEHRRSMEICRELEQKYKLIPAKKQQHQEGLPLKPVDYREGGLKRQIANVICPVARTYHFLSLNEYKALLSLYRIGVEEVRGEVNGKPYKGLTYSALNDKGEKMGNPINASSFGKTVGYEALEKRFEKSADLIKAKGLKERSKNTIASALKSHPAQSGFEKELAKNNISVLFRTNNEGRIYGTTFIDHQEKAVFNGSRLGKEFSANMFNQLFNPREPMVQSLPQHTNENVAFKPVFSGKGSLLGSLFGLLSAGSSPSDYEDEAVKHAKKKQKKKKNKL
ncbi:conjugal transfer protein MobB [uncultured Proteiniphilum sp.]|uniref:conjugal transfer protein MobB n=1 Tax=uncultured Proteiniphilum sp. TaxID=497637 RepID=UPI002614278F|nr:conjugal transfer protein MobB [uncultured Proteiniphilum sp.]